MDGDPGAPRRTLASASVKAERPRSRMVVSLAIALLLHAALLWMLREIMVPPDEVAWSRIELVLIEAEAPPLPVSPQVQEPPIAAPAPQPPPVEPLRASEPPELAAPAMPEPAPEAPAPAAADPAPRADVEPVVSTPVESAALDAGPIRLFRRDGRLALPEGVLEAPPQVASYIPVPREVPPWEDRPVALAYQESMFEAFWWVPKDESMAGAFFRKATVTKEFRLPWGTKVRCAWVLVIGACAW